jgi:hypothetical protein
MAEIRTITYERNFATGSEEEPENVKIGFTVELLDSLGMMHSEDPIAVFTDLRSVVDALDPNKVSGIFSLKSMVSRNSGFLGPLRSHSTLEEIDEWIHSEAAELSSPFHQRKVTQIRDQVRTLKVAIAAQEAALETLQRLGQAANVTGEELV